MTSASNKSDRHSRHGKPWQGILVGISFDLMNKRLFPKLNSQAITDRSQLGMDLLTIAYKRNYDDLSSRQMGYVSRNSSV